MSKEIIDIINVIVQIALALIALGALIYAIRQYGLSRKRYIEDSRPYIFIELARTTHGLLDLVISNVGKSAAKNIRIEFKPNIAIYTHSKKKINSFKFLKNLKFLSANKKFSFYFGSIIGGKTTICREFSIEVSYQDVEGNDFSNSQIIDPRDFIELVSLSRKDIHDVAKSLDEIKKELKASNDNSKKLNNQVEKGLTHRDAAYSLLDHDDLIVLLKNLLTDGVEGVHNTYPMERDAKVIAKLARDKLLSKSSLSDDDKKLIKVLNRFESSDFDFDTQVIVDEFLAVVK
ncbi:hypothetical protein A2707_03935 [Candidatus Saccharibacteria bacterium RIFCSPHIGHO2_01_FULL_45_15]|nr:MAG: hypothetical protein A2707_03935 [Candidatus Saccharibacteria bacterium RIFCSPHIGHO2_01_FULL_45_15]OGL31577.1 MAG: hypothetical protein A3E76_02485 [Candidatus Saccharibacteria bacterium RIFCSPHIGHO2_12_FULL_44_22]